ncbi:MAG: hypothetical protein GVY30_05680, partial [Chloroflexi bacterium]|nr:hypothetical protein [Chloroflexota bacterium]
MENTTNVEARYDFEQCGYGRWSHDATGLPCFDLKVGASAVNERFRHLIATGRLSALVDQWGDVELFTTEGGYQLLAPSRRWVSRSGLYLVVEASETRVSLFHSELQHNKHIRYGVGYATYSGEIEKDDKIYLDVKQVFMAPPHQKGELVGFFTLRNKSLQHLSGQVEARSDIVPGVFADAPPEGVAHGAGYVVTPPSGDVPGALMLLGSQAFEGEVECGTLCLRGALDLAPGESCTLWFAVGYGDAAEREARQATFANHTPETIQQMWKEMLKPVDLETPETWMRDECLWTYGQLLSFASYDSAVQEHYIALGGCDYGWDEFAVREVGETSMVLAPWNWSLTERSLLWMAKTQLANGDLPMTHNFLPERDLDTMNFESDSELWFVLGCCESVEASGNEALFDRVCPFWDQGEATMWEHLKRAFYWVRDSIGTGDHGLVCIRDGDWNDYLSGMGRQGKGESVMNSGMACRAFDAMARFARRRDDIALAEELETFVEQVRDAVGLAFDGDWFLRGYTDAGAPVGSYAEDRLFLNAQSWAALGRCGTPAQQRSALLKTIEKCHTPIGLTLMSRPYSGRPPEGISLAPIPPGEGENAGIWPQTVYWMVWALAEAGLIDEALEEWRCMSLRNHARLHPNVPFGI